VQGLAAAAWRDGGRPRCVRLLKRPAGPDPRSYRRGACGRGDGAEWAAGARATSAPGAAYRHQAGSVAERLVAGGADAPGVPVEDPVARMDDGPRCAATRSWRAGSRYRIGRESQEPGEYQAARDAPGAGSDDPVVRRWRMVTAAPAGPAATVAGRPRPRPGGVFPPSPDRARPDVVAALTAPDQPGRTDAARSTGDTSVLTGRGPCGLASAAHDAGRSRGIGGRPRRAACQARAAAAPRRRASNQAPARTGTAD